MENLEYWKKEWGKVGKEYILNKNTEDKNIKVWDESSKNYDETVCNNRVKDVIKNLKLKGYINENSEVLDIGCGTGSYSIELSKICKKVYALDYSDCMLNVLKEKIKSNNIDNIEIIKANWNDINLNKENMYKKFDLVISSLNPGCYNPDSLLKINEASNKSCCYIGTDGKSKDDVLEKADKFILGKRLDFCGVSDIIYPFNILYFSGYRPSIFYTGTTWKYKMSYEGSVNKLKNRYKEYLDKHETIDKIKEFVNREIKDGTFYHESKVTLGVITWEVV